MVLRYAANLKLARELYDSSKPKLQGGQEMIDTFKNVFDLPERSIRLIDAVEATAVALFTVNFLNKNISRLGFTATFGVLGVTAYKHFEADHGKEDAQYTLDLLGLAALSFADTSSKS